MTHGAIDGPAQVELCRVQHARKHRDCRREPGEHAATVTGAAGPSGRRPGAGAGAGLGGRVLDWAGARPGATRTAGRRWVRGGGWWRRRMAAAETSGDVGAGRVTPMGQAAILSTGASKHHDRIRKVLIWVRIYVIASRVLRQLSRTHPSNIWAWRGVCHSGLS